MVRIHSQSLKNTGFFSINALTLFLFGLVSSLASESAFAESKPASAARSGQSIVMNEYGLRRMTLDLPASEIAAQSQKVSVAFPKALRKALESALSDASKPSSPLAQALLISAADPDSPDNSQFTAQEFQNASQLLVRYMNAPSTTLRLVERRRVRGNSPSTSANWVFELQIPQLSDAPFWIVVDKSGTRPTYNFGG